MKAKIMSNVVGKKLEAIELAQYARCVPKATITGGTIKDPTSAFNLLIEQSSSITNAKGIGAQELRVQPVGQNTLSC